MFSTSQTALETHFQTNYTENTIEFENDVLNTDGLSEFTRFNVKYAVGKPTSLGGKCFRYTGAVIIQVFVRPGIGIARSVVLADIISGLYRNKVISGHFFGVPVITKITPESAWSQVQVYCEFYFEEYE